MTVRRSAGDGAAAEFDQYADSYEVDLQRGLRLSGEGSAFFAEGRVARLGSQLARLRVTPGAILDFGCGTGSAIPALLELRGAERALGVDVSTELVEHARASVRDERASFRVVDDEGLGGVMDLAFCNGVFHHIEPALRPAAVDYVRRALKPGGLFAFCENNPYNPGTRLVMRRIPFDRDAQTLTPRATRALLRSGGLEVVTTEYMFFFPRALRSLRAAERWLTRFPLGAQYMILARKPG